MSSSTSAPASAPTSASTPTSTPLSIPPTSPPSLYAQLSAYPFDTDPDFQHGLHVLLSSASASPQSTDLTLAAKCFYFARKSNTPLVDARDYALWLRSHRPDASSENPADPTTSSSSASSSAAAAAALLHPSLSSNDTISTPVSAPAPFLPSNPPAPPPPTTLSSPQSPSNPSHPKTPSHSSLQSTSSLAPAPTSPSSPTPPAPYPSSFTHLVALITSGETVPGTREIPDTVLRGMGSRASGGEGRRKPWERG